MNSIEYLRNPLQREWRRNPCVNLLSSDSNRAPCRPPMPQDFLHQSAFLGSPGMKHESEPMPPSSSGAIRRLLHRDEQRGLLKEFTAEILYVPAPQPLVPVKHIHIQQLQHPTQIKRRSFQRGRLAVPAPEDAQQRCSADRALGAGLLQDEQQGLPKESAHSGRDPYIVITGPRTASGRLWSSRERSREGRASGRRSKDMSQTRHAEPENEHMCRSFAYAGRLDL